GLGAFVRAGRDGGRPRGGVGAAFFEHGDVAAAGEAGGVVDRGDGDGEGLGGAGVLAAVGRAAGVLGADADGGLPVGVRGGGVGEGAAVVDVGLGGKEGVVVVGDRVVVEALAALVRRAGAEVGHEVGDGLGAAVFEDRLVRVGLEGEAGRVVDE